MFLGMIVELLSPEPVTKFLFVLTATNLIAFVGVDLFNNVVKGFTAMLDELGRARDFESVRAAGIHYGQRIGPTVARIVVMIATYGVAKFAGLFKGSALSLPGGSRAAALAESQGLPVAAIDGARSITLSTNGTVVIGLGTRMAMTAAEQGGGPPADTAKPEATVKGRLKAAGLPTTGKIRYVPPESWTPSQPLPRGPDGGYVDRFGNEWVKGPSRTAGQPYEWDVQLGRNATDGMRGLSRDGKHVNVSLDGEVTH
jgi:filamentous hemagglutinin